MRRAGRTRLPKRGRVPEQFREPAQTRARRASWAPFPHRLVGGSRLAQGLWRCSTGLPSHDAQLAHAATTAAAAPADLELGCMCGIERFRTVGCGLGEPSDSVRPPTRGPPTLVGKHSPHSHATLLHRGSSGASHCGHRSATRAVLTESLGWQDRRAATGHPGRT